MLVNGVSSGILRNFVNKIQAALSSPGSFKCVCLQGLDDLSHQRVTNLVPSLTHRLDSFKQDNSMVRLLSARGHLPSFGDLGTSQLPVPSSAFSGLLPAAPHAAPCGDSGSSNSRHFYLCHPRSTVAQILCFQEVQRRYCGSTAVRSVGSGYETPVSPQLAASGRRGACAPDGGVGAEDMSSRYFLAHRASGSPEWQHLLSHLQPSHTFQSIF